MKLQESINMEYESKLTAVNQEAYQALEKVQREHQEVI